MHSKPDTCMVQMGSSDEALAVIEHLQDCEVFGTKLSFRPSKQNVFTYKFIIVFITKRVYILDCS